MKTAMTRLGLMGVVAAAILTLPLASAWADDHRDRDRDRDRGPGPGPAWRDGDRDHRGGIDVRLAVPPRPAVVQRWVPGHYEVQVQRVLVEEGHYITQAEQVLVATAHWEDRVVPAVTQTQRDAYGRLYTVVIAPAHAERVWVPDVYQTRTTQVWCPPRYEDRQVRVWVDGCYVTETAPAPRPLISVRGLISW